MFIFKFWNNTQMITFTTDEEGNTSYVAVEMSDEEIDAMIAVKAHEGAHVAGWNSEWIQ